MPTIYLSPSTQENNMYVTGNSEEYYMNLIADAMEPYLRASGIQYVRNTPQMSAVSSIAASNAGKYDLHLALHSNAAPEGKYGTVTGSDVFYAPSSVNGRRAAEIFARNLRMIYPNPSKVRTVPTTSIGEVRQTRAPAVFLELAYHDNRSDANWITENINAIARNLAISTAEYFGLPLVAPMTPRTATVRTQSGNLNIRSRPNTGAPVLRRVPNGTSVTILGENNGWATVRLGDTVGFASMEFLRS